MSDRLRSRDLRDGGRNTTYAKATQGVLSGEVLFSDAVSGVASVALGTIPAGGRFVEAKVNILTAFNAGTTNTLTVGIASDTDYLLAAGNPDVADSETIGNLLDYQPTEDTIVYARYAYTGTAPTTGKAVAYVTFEHP
ncbi:MAG: hypothetical protein M0R22_00815 [Dehalococcoidia bacterium]|nr:hypothetical protein [Dehalococcoidia bacterium]